MALILLTSNADEPLSRHVILISIDGLRPDALTKANAPRLKATLTDGSFSLRAQTIYPSSTLPSHTSMLMGLSPDQHHVRSNHWYFRSPMVKPPTIFTFARKANFTTAMFAGKKRFVYLSQPGSLNNLTVEPPRFRFLRIGSQTNMKFYPGSTKRTHDPEATTAWFDKMMKEAGTPERHWPWSSACDSITVAKAAAKYLGKEKPNLLFVHLPDPDVVGHTVGWMSDAQLYAVHRSDEAVGILMEEVAKHQDLADTIFIVTADHGGHERTHGKNLPSDMTIPWLAWGKNIARGHEIQKPIITYDTAATVLHILGLSQPANFDGKPIREIFSDSCDCF